MLQLHDADRRLSSSCLHGIARPQAGRLVGFRCLISSLAAQRLSACLVVLAMLEVSDTQEYRPVGLTRSGLMSESVS